MMLVGLISDTHGRLDPLAYNALADCGHIIHAGDICDPNIIAELETLAPVTAVLGNNDFDEYGPSVSRYAKPVLEGVRFLVAHYPQDVRMTSFGCRAINPGDPIPDVCVHGHTHIPRLEWGKEARPAQLVINPGSATWARGGNPKSIGKILVKDGKVMTAAVLALTGEVLFSLDMA